MKTVASLTFGIVSSVVSCVAAAAVASIVMAKSESNEFGGLYAPDLWTAKPVRVDQSNQSYTRVSPVYSSYVTDAPKISLATRSLDPSPAAVTVAEPVLSPEHLSWCSQRYRSDDPARNDYRAFSGEMRTCTSPFSQQAGRSGPAMAQAGAIASSAVGSRTTSTWCSTRYQSYRAKDNTYQPYDGPRRQCQPQSNDVVTASN